MWRLSPVYDLVPQPQWEEDGQNRLTLSVGKQGVLATIENTLSRTADFGLKRGAAEKIVLEMAETIKRRSYRAIETF